MAAASSWRDYFFFFAAFFTGFFAAAFFVAMSSSPPFEVKMLIAVLGISEFVQRVNLFCEQAAEKVRQLRSRLAPKYRHASIVSRQWYGKNGLGVTPRNLFTFDE